MPEILFIGDEPETFSYRLLGLRTFTPAGPPDDRAWVERIAGGGYGVILVAEETARARSGAIEALRRAIDARSSLTIVPVPGQEPSEHLRFLRTETGRALGVDTWNADGDHRGGAEG
jgi:vacuolar-type H+-ATPase subunit F/Vma7